MGKLSTIAAVLLLSSVAHADRVHLKDGAVLEGRASRVGDRVVIEIESGAVTVDASEVQKIESLESPLDHVVVKRAALRPGDVQGRLALVRYCQAHQLSAHEAELLREILDLAPDNAEARAALGYVKHQGEWMTRDDAMLAQGYVRHEGQWVTPEQRMTLERYAAEKQRAELEREKAKLELDAVRARTENIERENNDRIRSQNAAPPPVTYFTPFAYWAGHEHYGRGRGHSHHHQQHVHTPPPQRARDKPRPAPQKPVSASAARRNPRVR
jgi:hypothetical protein